ncbi:ISAs1 family transposase [Desulfococcaceae bacterium HSG7]|nr:ISAs1 family transposase [Desulfococcaceae bacterium HSG7]
MNKIAEASIWRHFQTLTDPRQKGKIEHMLPDILIIALCAVISGADTWPEIYEYGMAKQVRLGTFLRLPDGIPSADTFRRVFMLIDKDRFESCFISWINTVETVTEGQVIAIDGKTNRGTRDKTSGKSPIHVVSAWASENRITSGQVETEEKSDEIWAVPELSELLEIKGCIVTIDAMGCQKAIAEKIIDKNADYALALKGCQANLHEDVKLFFNDALVNGFKDIKSDCYETIDGDHGRIEIRRYHTVSDIDWLAGKENWKGIDIIGMAESETHIGEKVITYQRFYISGMGNDAKNFGVAVRSCQGIENSVHQVSDVGFREDESRKRKGDSAFNFSILRHIAMNLLRKEKTVSRGIRTERMKAGWSDAYQARYSLPYSFHAIALSVLPFFLAFRLMLYFLISATSSGTRKVIKRTFMCLSPFPFMNASISILLL